jgi:hypothetical protein
LEFTTVRFSAVIFRFLGQAPSHCHYSHFSFFAIPSHRNCDRLSFLSFSGSFIFRCTWTHLSPRPAHGSHQPELNRRLVYNQRWTQLRLTFSTYMMELSN